MCISVRSHTRLALDSEPLKVTKNMAFEGRRKKYVWELWPLQIAGYGLTRKAGFTTLETVRKSAFALQI